MKEDYGIIDVWMQHPTPGHLNQPILDALRGWTGSTRAVTEGIPLEFTIGVTPKT